MTENPVESLAEALSRRFHEDLEEIAGEALRRGYGVKIVWQSPLRYSIKVDPSIRPRQIHEIRSY